MTQYGVDVTPAGDGLSDTPLHLSAQYGSPYVADYLCREVPDVEDINRPCGHHTATPLYLAAEELVSQSRQLRRRGTNKEECRVKIKNYTLIVHSLLRAGADISMIGAYPVLGLVRRQRVLKEYVKVLNKLRYDVMVAINGALRPHRALAVLLTHLLPVAPHHDGAHPHPAPSGMSFGDNEAESIAWHIAAMCWDKREAYDALSAVKLRAHSVLGGRLHAAMRQFIVSAVTQAASNNEVVGGTRPVQQQQQQQDTEGEDEQGAKRSKVSVPPLQCFALADGADSRPPHVVSKPRRLGLREVVHRARLDEVAMYQLEGVEKGFNTHLGDCDCLFEWQHLGYIDRSGDFQPLSAEPFNDLDGGAVGSSEAEWWWSWQVG